MYSVRITEWVTSQPDIMTSQIGVLDSVRRPDVTLQKYFKIIMKKGI